MRLVIEDDSGAAWDVIEGLENLNLSSEADMGILLDALFNTKAEIEANDYNPDEDDTDEEYQGDDIDPDDDPILDTDLMDANDDGFYGDLGVVPDFDDYDE